MDTFRCGRCQAVLAAVAAGPGEATGLLFDPVVERRVAAAVASHQQDCDGEAPGARLALVELASE